MSNAGAEGQLKGIAALAAAHEEHRGSIAEHSDEDLSDDSDASDDDLEGSRNTLDESRDLDESKDLDDDAGPLAAVAAEVANMSPAKPEDDGGDDHAKDDGEDKDDDDDDDDDDGENPTVDDEDLERDWNKWRRVAYVVELENYDKIVAKANRGTNCRKTKKRGKDSQKKRRGSKETAGSGDTALDEQIAERRRHESISDACGEEGPDEPDKAADSPAKGGEVRQAEAAS